MRRLFLLLFFLGITMVSFSQTCTISGSGTINWNNASPPTCNEGGNAGSKSIIIIPGGVNLNFNDNGDTWTGTRIEVYGTLTISAPGQVTINSNVVVKSGGTLAVSSKLSLGSSTGCGYTLGVESGGTVNIVGSTPDRLNICGQEIARGGTAGCNTYPAGPLPYCEPAGGFTGPFTFDQTGLPIELLFSKATKGQNKVRITWATASELNFDYFDIEKSTDGVTFKSIGTVKGNGTTSERHDYKLDDEKPVVGKNYYRLKSVDFDGYTEYFDVVMVDFDGLKNFSIYPNPSDGVAFKAETNFTPAQNAFVTIYTSSGKEVGRYQVMGDLSDLTMPVKLESGWYYARFISSEFTAVSRFLVK